MNIAEVKRNDSMSSPQTRAPRRAQDYVTIALFLLPAVILFALFLIYPIFRSAYYSLFNWNGLGRHQICRVE